MWAIFIPRARHHCTALKRAAWKPLISIPLSILGALAFVRDEFLSVEWQQSLKMSLWLLPWPWYLWAIGIFLIVILALLEDSFHPSVETKLMFGEIERDDIEGRNGRISCERRVLEIVNTGDILLDQCLVTVDRVIFDDGTRHELHAALFTIARNADGVSTRFTLGPKRPKRLVLTSRNFDNPRNPRPHEIVTEARSLPLYRGKSGTMEIVADGGVGDPSRVVLRFSVDHAYQLVLEKINASMAEPEGSTDSKSS